MQGLTMDLTIVSPFITTQNFLFTNLKSLKTVNEQPFLQ